MAAESITHALEECQPKQLNRATIADGKLLEYFICIPLQNRDIIVANAISTTSGEYYYNAPNDRIYHYNNGVADYNIHIYDDNVLSARDVHANEILTTDLTATHNIYAVNTQVVSTNTSDTYYSDKLSATDIENSTVISAVNVSAVNVKATNSIFTQRLRVDNDFYVNMGIGGQNLFPGHDAILKFVTVVGLLEEKYKATDTKIENNEPKWGSISAVEIHNSGSVKKLTPKVLKIEQGRNIVITEKRRGEIEIKYQRESSTIPVVNGIIDLTQIV